jgi:hypothetical protein
MALYHELGVKTGFTFAIQFSLLIFDSLGGGMRYILKVLDWAQLQASSKAFNFCWLSLL